MTEYEYTSQEEHDKRANMPGPQLPPLEFTDADLSPCINCMANQLGCTLAKRTYNYNDERETGICISHKVYTKRLNN